MSDNYESFDRTESYIPNTARIKVIGVGGGGINAVAGMLSKVKGKGVEFWAIDTDIETLSLSDAAKRIQLGQKLARGLGAGGNPAIGEKAAEESREEITLALEGADLVFITAGMGGGTGTGAARIVAEVSREMGALTIGVVTRPFSFEGIDRSNRATIGIDKLVSEVDMLVTISNDKLLLESEDSISNQAAFLLADDILLAAVRPIIDDVTDPRPRSLDFADMRSIIANAGFAYFGIGHGEGKSRVQDAALQAINSPLSEGSIKGARGVHVMITGGDDLSLFEVNAAGEAICEVVDPNANILFNAVIDESLKGEMQVSIIATGFTQSSNQIG